MTPCFAATGGGCMNESCGRWRHRAPGQRDSAVDDLVHHAVLAEAWPEAARYALAAGERASRRSAMTEAKAYLETAIAALSQQPVSVATMTMGIDARLSLRGVLVSMNDTSGIQEYLKEADNLAELAGDRLNLARVYISRGAILSHSGDLPGAIELSRTALDIMLPAATVSGLSAPPSRSPRRSGIPAISTMRGRC